ncbi:1-aminocyclopropane-1-carboxylate deaminase/D-cysteine desulfhydrase [Bacteroidota bacterium]
MNRHVFLSAGSIVLGVLAARSGGKGYLLHKLNPKGPRSQDVNLSSEQPEKSAVFRIYPDLSRHIPWLSLVDIPTPVEEIGTSLGMPEGKLWVKRDDLTSNVYGGNKVRKQEHLLADATLRGRKSLITLGGLGSNHSMATAVHGSRSGFEVHLCLIDQPVSKYVRQNLSGFLAAGAKIHYCSSLKDAYMYSRSLFRQLKREGRAPYFIPPGGTCGLSNVGHVNAALELAEQIRQGLLPVPDKLFIPAGTCGTIAGLIAGLKIAGLPTRVVGVRVVNPMPAFSYLIRYYAQKVAEDLRKFDKSVPKVRIEKTDFELLTNYLGEGYGAITPEGKAAVERVAERISLETTYTGKTLAACLDYCEKTEAEEKILFWNSYNSADFDKSPTYDGLPDEILEKLSL